MCFGDSVDQVLLVLREAIKNIGEEQTVCRKALYNVQDVESAVRALIYLQLVRENRPDGRKVESLVMLRKRAGVMAGVVGEEMRSSMLASERVMSLMVMSLMDDVAIIDEPDAVEEEVLN